jgi:hypothetical protein
MTTQATALREAAQWALTTLRGWANHGRWLHPGSALDTAKRNTAEAIPMLEAALAVAATSAGAQPTMYLVPDDCPRDDFDQPIIYLTNEVNLVAHSLTGSEGEEDALTELKGMARYVSNVWPGKTALQVLLEYEEAALPSAKRVPLSDEQVRSIVAAHGTGGWQTSSDMALFARAIERAHGITESKEASHDR